MTINRSWCRNTPDREWYYRHPEKKPQRLWWGW